MQDFELERPPVPDIRSDAMDVFIAWEKLRLLYNAVLAALVVVYALANGKSHDWWFGVRVVKDAV
jgi:hypothetical protein